jgi:putative ABC transport system permease protein
MTRTTTVRQDLRLTFVIARRLGRARWLLASSLTVVLAAMMVAAWYCILQAQSLTGEQIADQDLGVYGAYAGYGAGSIGPGSAAQAALAHRLAPVAGPDAQVALICNDFSASWLSDKSVTFTEMNWEAQPFPKKYQLTAGRWPRQAGEIAIVNPSRGDRSKVPSRIEAYGGRVRLSVVGAFDDRYSRSVELLAGPGQI